MYQDKILWNGDYTFFVDNIIRKEGSPEKSFDHWGQLRHRMRLGLRTAPHEYFRFTGRLSAYKFSNVLGGSYYGVENHPTYPSLRPTNDAYLRIDRMYADIFPPFRGITGAVGILPSTEGMPSDLQSLQARKSTYPNLFFNVTFPGVALVLHPHEFIKDFVESRIFFIYGHFSDPLSRTLGDARVIDDPLRFANSTSANAYVGLTEVNFKPKWADSFRHFFGYGVVANYKVTKDSRTLAAAATASSLNLPGGADMGSFTRMIYYAQLENFLKSNFNIFFGAAMNVGVGDPIEVPITGTENLPPPLAGFPYKVKYGFNGSIFKEDRYGKAIYFGASYDFQHRLGGWLGAPTVGYEFFAPEKNYIPFYTAGEDITERLENIGSSHKTFFTVL